MLQRSLWRELTLLSLPLLAIGGLFGWSQWQKRFRTPTIALSVRLDKPWPPKNHVSVPIRGYSLPENERMGFGWTAWLRGGPQSGYRFGWNERIIAKTPRGSVVVWEQNAPSKILIRGTVPGSIAPQSTFSTSRGLNNAIYTHRYDVDQTGFPVDTQSLEWQSAIAAIPSDEADPSQSPLPLQTLDEWSRIDGAATWKRTVPLPYHEQEFGPVVVQKQEPPSASDKNNPLVRVRSRSENRRTFCRVVALKGNQHRTLWVQTQRISGICNSISHSFSYGGFASLYSFDIRKVPADWGQIVFLCDTVFDTSGRAAPVSNVMKMGLSESALAAFEKQTGGYRVSRRLVLRPR